MLYAVDGKDMYNKGDAPQGFILDVDAGSPINTFKPTDKVHASICLLDIDYTVVVIKFHYC